MLLTTVGSRATDGFLTSTVAITCVMGRLQSGIRPDERSRSNPKILTNWVSRADYTSYVITTLRARMSATVFNWSRTRALRVTQ
jgi:hypothetical protein